MQDILYPNITGRSEQEQLTQVKSYLAEMVGQLNYALQTLSRTSQTAVDNTERIRNQQVKFEEKNTPGNTFRSIKSLIIKSADIVEQYTEEINRKLNGSYVAQSAFGTFRQETEQSIRENSEGIARIFQDIQSISQNVDGIGEQIAEVNAYIRTGKLYDDDAGIPVFGVEIGQKNTIDGAVSFQKYARLTSGKLSFFDANDNEVAYVSEQQLHITNADVQMLEAKTIHTNRIRMGDYMWSLGADGHYTLS